MDHDGKAELEQWRESQVQADGRTTLCVCFDVGLYICISLGVSVLAFHLNGKKYWRRQKKQDDHVNTIARILEITMHSSSVTFLNIKYPEYLSSRTLATNMYMALRTFYVHLETRQTTWDNPAELIMCHLALEVQQTVFQILNQRIGEFAEGESNPTARNGFCVSDHCNNNIQQQSTSDYWCKIIVRYPQSATLNQLWNTFSWGGHCVLPLSHMIIAGGDAELVTAWSSKVRCVPHGSHYKDVKWAVTHHTTKAHMTDVNKSSSGKLRSMKLLKDCRRCTSRGSRGQSRAREGCTNARLFKRLFDVWSCLVLNSLSF